MKSIGQTNRTRFRNQFIKPLIKIGLLEYTIPDKPQSSKQKYRVTEKGDSKCQQFVNGTLRKKVIIAIARWQ